MKKSKGFTLVEMMVVIAVIVIIAAIAIPNLLRSRIIANESTAVSVIMGYVKAQTTFQIGGMGQLAGNTSAGMAGYASNYRNLYYGTVPVEKGSAEIGELLELISKAHADAATEANDNQPKSPTVDVRAKPRAIDLSNDQNAYQGYYFMSPVGVNFATKFAQLAIPVDSSATGTRVFWVGSQGTVLWKRLNPNQSVEDTITAIKGKTPSDVSSAYTADEWESAR